MSARGKRAGLLRTIRAHLRAGTWLVSTHAAARQQERAINRLDIVEVLNTGYHEKKKDEYKTEFRDWNYAVRGKTIDGHTLRVVVSCSDERLLVVTVIPLDRKSGPR